MFGTQFECCTVSLTQSLSKIDVLRKACIGRLTSWMHHKSHDKKGTPTLSAAEAAEGRGASFTTGARRSESGSMQGMSPGQVGSVAKP